MVKDSPFCKEHQESRIKKKNMRRKTMKDVKVKVHEPDDDEIIEDALTYLRSTHERSAPKRKYSTIPIKEMVSLRAQLGGYRTAAVALAWDNYFLRKELNDPLTANIKKALGVWGKSSHTFPAFPIGCIYSEPTRAQVAPPFNALIDIHSQCPHITLTVSTADTGREDYVYTK